MSVLLIGIVLDLRTGGGAATLADYRVAMASQLVLMVVAGIGLWATTRDRLRA